MSKMTTDFILCCLIYLNDLYIYYTIVVFISLLVLLLYIQPQLLNIKRAKFKFGT